MTNYHDVEDDSLINRVFLLGDQLAFEEIYRRNYKFVHDFIFGLTRNLETANDVAQSTFLTLFRKIKKEKIKVTSLKSYSCGIARNELFSYNRQKDKTESKENFSEKETIVNIGHELEKKESRKDIQKAINQLPYEEREVIILWVYGEMTDEEIGITLNIPTNTVKTRKRKAKEKLREILYSVLKNS